MTVRGVTQCVCGLGCSRNFQYQLRNECLVQLIGNVSGNVFFNPSYSAHKNKLLLFVLYVEPKLIELVDSPMKNQPFVEGAKIKIVPTLFICKLIVLAGFLHISVSESQSKEMKFKKINQ